MQRWKFILMVIFMSLALHSCAYMQDQTHNKAGGYIPECGNLPGLLGDDC